MNRARFFVALTLALGAAQTGSAQVSSAASALASALEWSELPPLPDPIGLAGAFAGVSEGSLIVAGGANFPGGRPWEGHPKVWHDRIFVLDSPEGAWRVADERLPRPTAYGVAVTWDDAVVCVGGGNAERHFADAFLLRKRAGGLEIEPLPSLPEPSAFFTGALADDVLYVMGGIDQPDAVRCSNAFFALDLAADERRWTALEPWPGPARYLAIAGAQSGSVFLFGGIELSEDANGNPTRVTPYLADAYRYAPANGWTTIASLPHPLAASPSPASAVGPSHLFVFSGDDGSRAGTDLRDAHPGFPPEALAYHTITDTWTRAGDLPGPWPPVTTTSTEWNGKIVLPTGEARPGVRTPRVLTANPRTLEPDFGWANYTVLVLYLSALIAMGVYFSRREKSTNDYFLGGRRVPWWAAGVSIVGTQLSAITFLAIPAKSFATDWLYFIQNLGIVAIAPVVVLLYLPYFRKLELTTAYEYLEHRFNLAVRLFGAFSFIVFQLARMGIILLLPSLALTAVTGMDVRLCILAMGVLCTIYTVLGGIEAVIWTDVLQVVVLFGGALAALAVVVSGVDGGFASVLQSSAEYDKLRLVQVEWDWTGPAIGVILLGAVFNNLVPYTSDQAVVQRYLTTRNEKQAARSIWAGTLLTIPASLLFFSVGTALFAFYQQHPARLNPLAPTDQVFAWFIVHELPPVLSGLVIAGVFAAAMSSLDSSMNSIAAVVTTDLLRRLAPLREERQYLKVARWSTVVLGFLATGAALYLSGFDGTSLFDQFLAYLGLLGGTMAGLFLLGILSERATPRGALVGAAVAIGALVYVKTQTSLSGLLYATVGMTTCVVVGYVASRVLGGRPARSIFAPS